MGAVLGKCLSASRHLAYSFWNRFFFYFSYPFQRKYCRNSSDNIISSSGNNEYAILENRKCNDKEKGKKKEKGLEKQPNYLIRAIKEMTIYERALLTLALVFLGANAYTNLNFPRIMGECIETNELNYMNCSFLDKILQKGNIFTMWNKKLSGLNTLFYYFPYFVIGGIASYFRIYFTNRCVKSMENRLKKKMHKKILIEESEEFRGFKSSDYLVNCTFNEIKYCSRELVTSITQMIRYLNSIIGGMVSMTLISSYLTKYCILLVPSYGFLVLLILKKINNVKLRTTKMDEKQMARFSDTLQKRNIVSLFGNEYYENKYFSKELDKVNKLNKGCLSAEAWFYCFLNIGTNIVLCSVLCLGKIELKNKHISHGQLVSFIAYSSMLGLGIVGMLKLKKEVSVLQMSLHKIYEILDFSQSNFCEQNKKGKGILNNVEDIAENKKNIQLLKNNTCNDMKDASTENVPAKKIENNKMNIPLSSKKDDMGNNSQSERSKETICEFPTNIKGSLKYENVNFSYNSFDDEKKKCALKNINFEIKEGEKIAIIGRSGSGKTSIWKLLTQEYKYDGNIYIDTYNLKDINRTYFKKKIISINEQECTILNRSLYENLVYGLIPVKVGQYKETSELIFDNVNKKETLYGKIDALLAKIRKETETKKSEGYITEKDIIFILQNYEFDDTTYKYLKHKCQNYLKKKDGICTVFSDKEQKFIKYKNKKLMKKMHSIVNDETKAILNGIVKTTEVSTGTCWNNKNDIVSQSLLKGYSNKVNEINASVKILCEELNLNDLINSFPQDIQSPVNNTSLSTGQKQRVALIRSLMKNTPIYVFDEVTSALDDSNAEKVFQTINSLIPNKTVIHVTHSSKLLSYMDKIIVIDNGEIKLIGTYEEIKNDPYYLNIFPSKNKTI